MGLRIGVHVVLGITVDGVSVILVSVSVWIALVAAASAAAVVAAGALHETDFVQNIVLSVTATATTSTTSILILHCQSRFS